MAAIVNIRDVIHRGGKIYRVIALSKDLVVLFPIEGKAFKIDCVPFHVLDAELRDGISTRIEDPASNYLVVSHTPKEIEAAQRRFSLIEPIVHNTEAILIICQNNFRHSFSLTWSGKTCDIRRSL